MATNTEDQFPYIPEELVGACATSKCVLFTGPGMSAQLGFPNRFQVLDNLIRSGLVLKKSEQEEFLGMLGPAEVPAHVGVVDEIGEILSSRVPRQELMAALQTLFKSIPPRRAKVFEDLKAIPFASALTINWDSLLEQTFSGRRPMVITGAPSEPITEAFNPNQFSIAKLHGQLTDPDSFRFTSDDYRIALRENHSFAKIIVSFVETQTLLFLGMALSSITNFFAGIPYRLSSREKMHYALVPGQKNFKAQQDRFRARYGVMLLPYFTDPEFSAVPLFVANLRERVTSKLPRTKMETSDVRLTELRVNNIGPFRDLRVSFDSSWSVILGNNGSGKSTLLKAIALGLCGDDPEASTAGSRLLSVGQNSGFIELEITGITYRTDLIREGDRVRVECNQVTPLLQGDLAVMGFPPLRGASERTLSSTFTPGPPKPVVADLLPLLFTSFDTRLDSLKGWVIYLHVNSMPNSQIAPAQAARAVRQRESFFQILEKLVPGSGIQYGEVDLQRWQVFLTTPDGKVPLEQVSQGITSLFGWTGTALQRMYEIYPDSQNPEQESAILLVDEIDAHLHPEWQRSLIGLTRKLFPRLQVIATTHSPLIVAGMKANEVFVASRDPESKLARVCPAPVEFEGMRADQILTSPLFGLVTTRSSQSTTEIDRYSVLIGQSSLSKAEKSELKNLKARLASMLNSGETEIERSVEAAIDKVLLDLMQPAKIYKVEGSITPRAKREVKSQLARLIAKGKKK